MSINVRFEIEENGAKWPAIQPSPALRFTPAVVGEEHTQEEDAERKDDQEPDVRVEEEAPLRSWVDKSRLRRVVFHGA